MARGKTTAIQRFAALLKQSSTITELKHFREQARDVFRLGCAEGLECWIEARRELGLLVDPAVDRAASGLQAAVASAINEALGPLPKPKPRRSWDEQCRLINEREGLSPDLATLVAAAVEHDTALELNANPWRLDLRDRHVRMAAEAGALVVIDTDAHRPQDFDLLRYGILTARRGGLGRSLCPNCWDADRLHAWIRSKRGARD